MALRSFFSILLCALPMAVRADDLKPSNPLDLHAARPSSVGASFDVDFLNWVASESNLQYAYDGAAANSNATTPAGASGRVKFPDWKWDRGLKLGLGIYTGYDRWDVFTEYTWFETSTSSQIDAGNSAVKRVWNVLNYTQTTLNQAAASWGLQFNTVDVSLQRKFYPGRAIMLQPYLGMKGSSQEQSYLVNYSGTNMTQPGSASMDAKETYWGIGPRVGLDASWYLYKKLSLFGRFAATVLWERFNVNRIDTLYNDLNATETISLSTSSHFSMINPVLESALGLQFEYWGWKDKLRFMLRASYEYQVWFEQNQFIHTILESPSTGNLNLQGVTIKGEIEF